MDEEREDASSSDDGASIEINGRTEKVADLWATPPNLLTAAREHFGINHFDFDACALPHTSVAPQWLGHQHSGAFHDAMHWPWNPTRYRWMGDVSPCDCGICPREIRHDDKDLPMLSTELAAHIRMVLRASRDAVRAVVVQGLWSRELATRNAGIEAVRSGEGSRIQADSFDEREGARKSSSKVGSRKQRSSTEASRVAFPVERGPVGDSVASLVDVVRVLRFEREDGSGSFPSALERFLSGHSALEHGPGVLSVQLEQGSEASGRLGSGRVAICPDCRVAGFGEIRHDFKGTVWVNPPYSRGNLLAFAQRALTQFSQWKDPNSGMPFPYAPNLDRIIFLGKLDPSTKWFKLLAKSPRCHEVVMLSPRVHFINATTGKPQRGTNFCSVLFDLRRETPKRETYSLLEWER